MATKNGDQSPHDTSSLISDSGLGSLTSPEENAHQYLEEETLTNAIQTERDSGGSAALQESYDKELWRLVGKNVSKLTFKGIDGPTVNVSENKFQTSTPSPLPATLTWTYSHGGEVSPERLEHVRNRGEGKSDEIRQIYSALADHLQGFKKAQDCYLLPIENGILFSRKEITTSMDNIPESICVEHEPRRGKFFDVTLEATVSQDRGITYTPGQQGIGGGNFLVLDEIGSGYDGTVYKAEDVLSAQSEVDQFAVKKIKINKEMLKGTSFSAFLKLSGCEQTCRAYGVILDEADNCVYFLMELLEGKTLCDLLVEGQPISIPLAVDYAIDILKGLQYIHSKGLIHSDIIGVNIMIVGPRAIIIDTTGARNASSPKSLGYLRDVANAIKLLNNMLWNSTVFSPPPWEASAEDRQKFNKKTLKKLEHLLRRQAEYLAYNSPMIDTIDTIETLLQDLGEISQELKGLRSPSSSSGSSEDEACSPLKENQALRAELQASKAETKREKEKREKAEQHIKELMEKDKKQNDRMDALMAELQEMKLKQTADKNEDPRAEK